MLSIYLFVFFFSSLNNEHQFQFREACEDFVLSDNSILIAAELNRHKSLFRLNFGVGQSSIEMGERNEPINYKLVNRLFSEEVALTKTSPPVILCKAEPHASGSLGYELFRKGKPIIHLDFDTSTICNLASAQLNSNLEDGYREIKADFRSDGLYILVALKRKPYALKFDTGYRGNIAMRDQDAALFSKEACRSYLSLTESFKVYPNKWISIGDNLYNSTVTVTKIRKSVIGMGLLKGFNWIIDFRNEKVYFKKNGIGLDSENIFPPDYQVAVIADALVFAAINANGAEFRPGDKIIKVNGTLVTTENRCEIKSIIENTANKNRLDIEVQPSD